MQTKISHDELTSLEKDIDADVLRIQALVDAILKQLEDAGIPYCILRNRHLIPKGLMSWSDLDIMVPSHVTRDRLVTTLWGLRPAQIVPFHDALTYMFFPINGFFLRVDIFHGDDGWMGAPYTNNREIMAARWDDRGIMVASPLHQAYLALITKLLRGGEFPSRYRGLISDEIHNHPIEFHRLLEDHLGMELADQLMNLVEGGRLADTPELTVKIRRNLRLYSLRQHPMQTTVAFLKHIRHGLLRRYKPYGLDIVILSADDALPSDVCSALAHSPVRPVPGTAVHYVARLRDDSAARGLNAGGARQASSKANHAIGALFHTYVPIVTGLLVQWSRWLLRDRALRARLTFLVRDSHLLETGIDDFRTSSAGGHRVAHWIRLLAPKPDVLIVLDTPRIEKWRSEEPQTNDAIALRDAYRRLANSVPNGIIVDATRPLDLVVKDVMEVIGEVTTRITKQRVMRDKPEWQDTFPAVDSR